VRFCIDLPNFGRWADPRAFAEFAGTIERAGWDGISVWDHVWAGDSEPVADPWVLLSAAAVATDRLRLMTLVTPLPRRHPWNLARQAVSVDLLSEGRLILGVGSGAPSEYARFHGESDLATRAEMLDEGLAILAGLWTGEAFEFHGSHYEIDRITFRPPPRQRPRIPIWVAATWPRRRPVRRAALWDGVAPLFYSDEDDEYVEPTPEMVHSLAEYAAAHRTVPEPLDLAIGADMERAGEFEAAGATWIRHGWFPEAGLSEEAWIDMVGDGPPR